MAKKPIEYNLSLTQEHVVIIGAALRELPWKIAAPVLEVLQGQITEQDKARTTPEVKK